MKFGCILFDLDGTLVDSQADLVFAVNLMLSDLGFKTILGGDSVPERKPSPVPLLNAAAQCHIIPSECLMIGDTRIDIIAGKAAGMKTAGFAGGFRGRAELEAAGADYIFDHYDELLHKVNFEF